MDTLKKLLRKLSGKEREKILRTMNSMKKGETKGLNIQKIKGTDMYRVRTGRFRIFFSYDGSGSIRIHDVKMRNEQTYKNK